MTDLSGSQPRELTARTLEIAERASELTLKMLAGTVKNWNKTDQSPVTEIDLAVDKLLREDLGALFPAAGWLSEETVDDRARLDREFLWIVDPIDGTRSLLRNIPEFTISIALARRGVGVTLGVIVNPRTSERFVAVRGEGAREVGVGPLKCRPREPGALLQLLVSRTEEEKGLWRDLPCAVIGISSLAYKLAKVARGDVDATLTPWRRSEWDAAAGQLIVEEAGGIVRDGSGDPLRYNQLKPTLKGVLAASPGAFDEVLAMAPELRRRRQKVLAWQANNEPMGGDR